MTYDDLAMDSVLSHLDKSVNISPGKTDAWATTVLCRDSVEVPMVPVIIRRHVVVSFAGTVPWSGC